MSDPTNDDRAEWAQNALNAFQATTQTDEEDAISDLVCDLLHLAAKRGEDPETILRRARSNYEAEVEDEARLKPGN